MLDEPPLLFWEAALSTRDRCAPEDPWPVDPPEPPGALVSEPPGDTVVVVCPGAAGAAVAPLPFGRAPGATLVEVADAAAVPPLAPVEGAGPPGVAVGGAVVGDVVAGVEEAWGGGTSVDALQICAYEGAAAGGGLLELSGWSSWNCSPKTSSDGLDTDCSVGPLLAYTHDPEEPCQYDQ